MRTHKTNLLSAIERGVEDQSQELFSAIAENIKDYMNRKIGVLKLTSNEKQKEILTKLQKMLEKE